jgi:hypothetical protein
MATLDPAVARLKILEALKEEFMDILDDGEVPVAELAKLNSEMTDFSADILDAFRLEVIAVRGDDEFDVRLRIPKYDDSPEGDAA